MANKKSKFYVVKVGRTPGIYGTWEECRAETDSFPGAKFKSFKTLEEAERAFEEEELYKPINNGCVPFILSDLHPFEW